MKGRKPTPTALKLLQGNPGKRKIDTLHEPTPVIGLGAPPDYLDETARRMWFETGPQLVKLGTLGESDAHLFALLCQAHSDNLWHSAEIQRLRALKRRSGKQDNQLQTHESKRSKAAASIQKLGAEFGIGAASRTRIKINHDDGQTELPLGEPRSPLERAMAGARSA